jgi:hypothetical protein
MSVCGECTFRATAEVLAGPLRKKTVPKRHFRSTPINGHHQTVPAGPVRATSGLMHRSKHQAGPFKLRAMISLNGARSGQNG